MAPLLSVAWGTTSEHTQSGGGNGGIVDVRWRHPTEQTKEQLVGLVSWNQIQAYGTVLEDASGSEMEHSRYKMWD
jgi:hypothetical protein